MSESYKVTKEGLKCLKEREGKIKKELAALVVKKREAIELCGDWDENPELYDIESKERVLIKKLSDINAKIGLAEIIAENDSNTKAVRVESRVTVRFDDGTEKVFVITDPELVDLSRGMISYASPLGSSLIGFFAGDFVTYTVANNVIIVEVVSIVNP